MKLKDLIVGHFRLAEQQKRALHKLGLVTISDLLFNFPVRYGDVAQFKNITDLQKDDLALIYGKVTGLKTSRAFRKKIPMAEATLEDESGKIKIIWFHQPYIAKMLPEDSFVKVEGKVGERKGVLYLTNPEIEKIDKLPVGVGNSLFGKKDNNFAYPVYAETRGITSKWFYHALQKVLKSGILEIITEPIPTELLEKYNLPGIKTSLIWIHAPQKEVDSISARKRFAFQEIFFIQLEKYKERKKYEEKPSFAIEKSAKEMNDFIKRFPFKATNAQSKAVNIILEDFAKPHAMSRLLEGDVGSGKTAVAAATVYAVTTTRPLKHVESKVLGRPSAPADGLAERQDFGNLQTAYMAPTEILAEQHFDSFIKYFAYLNINIGLITGSGCKKFPSKLHPTQATDISRAQLLKWVENGEIPILVGTHALIQKSVQFKNLAYIIIDEQHRFGVRQRQQLRKKDDISPHLLSMTATPIPRTLALTIYGDLDLTLLDEMPHGRKPVITEIVLPNEREKTYTKIKEEMAKGRQLYVICPRIFEPDPLKETALNVKSVTEEAERLNRDIFPNKNIGILHSKMSSNDKEKMMLAFKNAEVDILVATSVVEVGVNVPNATLIIIEGAERFGLAQLHQLRGRVIRSNDQAYCFVFSDTKTAKTFERLKALKTAKNGFELAEFDLAQRGAGELYGRKQWGISDLAMEGIKNIKMVEAARLEAHKIVDTDPELENYPLLQEKITSRDNKIHFE
ncbi:MAG: ATP-dependent DNA helicase RecG [Parcubacteria group bacterium]|nr:ATP-dependent DNA helicase RecG [Parcubacteria group bacterium]